LPAPQLWHPDDAAWIRRSHLGDLMRRAAKGENPHDLVLVRADGIDASDVSRFWGEFSPFVVASNRHDWKGLRSAVEDLRRRYDRAQLYRWERVAARYAVLLEARLASLVPSLSVANGFGFKLAVTGKLKTGHHVRLFAYHVLGEGREAYDSLFRDPSAAVSESERVTMQSANYVQTLFRYEAVLYQCQKLRLMQAFTEHEGRAGPSEAKRKSLEKLQAAVKGIVGSLDVVDFLKTQMAGPEDVLDTPEAWPRFRMDATGEVRPVRGE
jgi:hypothetical protein